MYVIITNNIASYVGNKFNIAGKGSYYNHFTSEIKEAKTFNTGTEADNFAKQIIEFAQNTLNENLFNKIISYRVISVKN